jgi:hypothetical protein
MEAAMAWYGWGSPVGLAILLVGAVAVLLGFAVLGLCLSSFLPFADSAKGRCPRSGRRGHEHRL